MPYFEDEEDPASAHERLILANKFSSKRKLKTGIPVLVSVWDRLEQGLGLKYTLEASEYRAYLFYENSRFWIRHKPQKEGVPDLVAFANGQVSLVNPSNNAKFVYNRTWKFI